MTRNGLRVAALMAGSLAALSVCGGCRASQERDPQRRTIVIRDAAQPGRESAFDVGDRPPSRIEVVIDADTSGGAIGPSPLSALVGRSVRIQFRRDALGAAAPAPIPPTGQGPGGRAVHLDGFVRSVAGGWLVLEHNAKTSWVPQAAILVIEVSDQPSTAPSAPPASQ